MVKYCINAHFKLISAGRLKIHNTETAMDIIDRRNVLTLCIAYEYTLNTFNCHRQSPYGNLHGYGLHVYKLTTNVLRLFNEIV